MEIPRMEWVKMNLLLEGSVWMAQWFQVSEGKFESRGLKRVDLKQKIRRPVIYVMCVLGIICPYARSQAAIVFPCYRDRLYQLHRIGGLEKPIIRIPVIKGVMSEHPQYKELINLIAHMSPMRTCMILSALPKLKKAPEKMMVGRQGGIWNLSR